MRNEMLLALAVLLLSGCASLSRSVAVRPNTLMGNDRFPASEIKAMAQRAPWQKIKELEYVGYVVFTARIEDTGKVTIEKATESYPDDSRSQLARALADQVVIHPSLVGTHMLPRAEIYVVFYEKLRDGGNLALIFGKQVGYSFPGIIGNNRYLNTVPY